MRSRITHVFGLSAQNVPTSLPALRRPEPLANATRSKLHRAVATLVEPSIDRDAVVIAARPRELIGTSGAHVASAAHAISTNSPNLKLFLHDG
ncbi:MAG TPA: hypothetical protein VL326_25965 [Kofleriaceae bacterium]|nr:hypothetical protein [Kofleriaceae bacterium]